MERDAIAHSVHNSLPSDAPQLEQRATGRKVPGDFALRLTQDADKRPFYDLTVTNTLTDHVTSSICLASDTTTGLISVLNKAHRKTMDKHGAYMAGSGGHFVPLVVSTTVVWHPDSIARLRELSR